MKPNQDLREQLRALDIKQYKAAEFCGVHASEFSKLISRNELSADKKEAIINSIEAGMRGEFRPIPRGYKHEVNEEIYQELRKNGISVWQLAEAMGISESRLYTKLRKQLSDKESKRIIWIINNRGKYMSMIGLTGEEV